jgi:hypothetical protein
LQRFVIGSAALFTASRGMRREIRRVWLELSTTFQLPRPPGQAGHQFTLHHPLWMRLQHSKLLEPKQAKVAGTLAG